MFLAGNVFAEAAAMLEPTGRVLVNENQVNRVSTVFTGDKVHTGADSGALLSGRGNTVLLASNSALTVGPSSVALDSGAASMTMSPAGSAKVGDLTLTSSGGPAAYDVTRTAKSIQIKVKSGKLLVARAGVVTPLNAGSQQMFASADASSSSNNNANSDETDPHTKRNIAIGIAVAVAAGLIVWFTTNETSHIVP